MRQPYRRNRGRADDHGDHVGGNSYRNRVPGVHARSVQPVEGRAREVGQVLRVEICPRMLVATLPPRRRHVGLGRVRVGAVVRTRRACGKVVRLRGLPDGT